MRGWKWAGAGVLGLALMGALGGSPPVSPEACLRPAQPVSHGSPEYYEFPMVPTGRVPGTGNALGTAQVWFPHTPFGVAVTADGSYRYEFRLQFERLRLPREGAFVVWVTSTDLDRIEVAGVLTDATGFKGEVGWNKFLVVVTHEPAFDPDAQMWSGPVVIRGMSRSGMMHTMAGHGPFEQEKCASFGY